MIDLCTWSSDFVSGNLTIDAQHKYLFILINDFAKNDADKVSNEEVVAFLTKLYDYCTFHFTEEEELMAKCEYPLIEHHAKLHKDLKKTVKRLLEQSKNDELCIQYTAIINFCLIWLNEHIAQEDLTFVNFCKNRHHSLDQSILNALCEISTIGNKFLGVGKIKSIDKDFIIIQGKKYTNDIPLPFNTLVKIVYLSPKNNERQTFVAVVFYAHKSTLKLFNPTIIQTENKRGNFRIPIGNTKALLTFNENRFHAKIVDISESGIQITTNAEIKKDDIVQIDFSLQNTKFSGNYKVVRIIKQRQNQAVYGLNLEKMDDALFQKIAMFVFNKQCLLRQSIRL